jgi:hypothetical protein
MKISLVEIYIAQPTNMEEIKYSNSKSKKEENQECGEKLATKELFNITIKSKTTNTNNE